MKLRTGTILASAMLFLAATASWGALAPYTQDFEALDQMDPDALANDGWLVFANVFTPAGGFIYNYGPFVAPNGGPGFSALADGEGGPDQGLLVLNTYSDYNNIDHANGNTIEANIFQEQVIGAMDVGTTWLFEFQAKRANLEGNATALAFFKTLDPNNGFALTNFITVDMTSVATTWSGRLLSIFIDPSLEGQILQFGFLNTATNYEGTGVFYDNIRFVELSDQCPMDMPPADDESDDDDSDSGNNVLTLTNEGVTSGWDGLLEFDVFEDYDRTVNSTHRKGDRGVAGKRSR